ncbi:MAG: hypothetical protein NUV80_01760 [Candidatus Berkelbacteria bacterium]|nr:hypothetical protein [Candidatus Berkelbacteria bacterium]MCR4307264.1 hypothetical protein [Candidatus Berkelbacteria bacterium]
MEIVLPFDMQVFFSNVNWPELVWGAILGSILIPLFWSGVKLLQRYYQQTRPIQMLLGRIGNNREVAKVFVRDFILPQGSQVLSIEPRHGVGVVPNVPHLWPDVEGRTLAYVVNVLGRAGKTENINIVRMSEDEGEWNANIIVLGAQAQKCFDFYEQMEEVAYKMDGSEIYNYRGRIIPRETGYGYGIILKARNPFNSAGTAFLIGGFGTLGTISAAYYFKENFEKLGREFGQKNFGVVVRCPISAGEEAVERLRRYDKSFN